MINKYPYSDMHELNADWLLSKTAELEGKVKDLEEAPKGVTSVTPYYNSGTKIADYEQDGVAGEIYIPNNPAVLEKSALNRFDDGIDSYFKKVVSSIECVQMGSGVPSPSNPRPIYGFTDCTVTDVDNLDTPTETNTATISFGAAGTVYDGYVNLVSGKLVVDKALVDMGNLTWSYYDGGSGKNFFWASITGKKNEYQYSTVKCEIYDNLNTSVSALTYAVSLLQDKQCVGFATSGGDPRPYFYIRDDDYTDATLFTNAVNGHYLLYPLTTPLEYQLTPTQLRSLVGANRLIF